MKKKTVVHKKVEHHKKPEPKKIEVKAEKHTHEVVKEVQSESHAAVLPDSPVEPVNLAASLPVHTPGLERC